MFSSDCFAEIESIAQDHQMGVRCRYDNYYQILVAALNYCTRNLTLEFSGPFARLDHLCRQCHYKELNATGYAAILALRGRCTHLKLYTDKELESYADSDLKALCDFLSALFVCPIPVSLALLLPNEYKEEEKSEKIGKRSGTYLRLTVEKTDEERIYALDEEGVEWCVPWQYTIYQRTVDLSYMCKWLHASSQLNLIRPERCQDNMLIAEHVVFEPDYLIDTSAVAGCFKVYGASPYNQLMKRLMPFRQTAAILLGNFAGQMLDEEICSSLSHLNEDELIDFEDAKRRFFANNTLSLLTCEDLQERSAQEKFDADARMQQQNIRRMVRTTFAEDRSIELEKVVLEPTFYCEMLGIQGRLDLMQLDKHVLMEQKSGKRDEYRHSHKEDHYVQMLLYQAMLHYAYTDDKGKPLSNSDVASYLLYSRYEDGLIKESPAPILLAEALKLRNQLAYLDLYLSHEKSGRAMIEALTPEHLNTKQARGVIWDIYNRPQIAEVLDTIHAASAIEKDYFYRMLRFVAREQVLGKMGNSLKEASGFAALWNCTATEKKEAGNLLDTLTIGKISETMEEVTLLIHSDENEVLPNFREGDIVVMYAYPKEDEPDARRDMLLRAKVKELMPDHIVLHLNAPQHNMGVYHLDNDQLYWALEHDYMEATNSGLYRGLFAFLQAPKSRRELLLGQRMPQKDATRQLRGSYGKFDELVLKAKQADDFFLLIGPPGTGKTSCGLVNILKEHLAEEGCSILMVSYTNRAVEEICSKLEAEQIDYLHIGHVEEEMTGEELAQKYANVRVVVGTTTSITSHANLFALRSFDLCIIDEASQILEPHLLTILSAKTSTGEAAVRKFVMIGDHKQLPAVVQQGEEESAIEEPSLQTIGLYNCRQSLFERLLRGLSPDFYHTLSAQGRMHHDVADFANRHFYNSLLTEVPLNHQQRDIPYKTSHKEDRWLKLLTERRVTFIPVRKVRNGSTSDKTNPQEAQVIAEIVEAVYRLYQENGMEFSARQTVGVIVPYRHQISTIRKYLQGYGIAELMEVAIDTVERFQGSQRDVIVYGFTVSKPYQLDFLTNNVFVDSEGHAIDRKLNVALTRARESLLIVGNPEILSRNELFNKLLTYK